MDTGASRISHRWLSALVSGVLTAIAASPAAAQVPDLYLATRIKMVHDVVEADGVTNKAVLKSMRSVPRHLFCRPVDKHLAYRDGALPIGFQQTISPPFVVAYMTQTIDPQPTDRVLEIGTGSGYQAAILSGIVKEVYTIEIVPQLGRAAALRLKKLGYSNVQAMVGDGYKGWPDKAPFDKIIVTCSPEKVPQALIDQLKDGGKLLIPLGERYQQVFHLYEKKGGKLANKKLIPTLFVPMTGISEAKRAVKPDPAHPRIVNGSFEKAENKDGRPDNWHYQRKVKLVTGDAPDGKRYVSISNAEPGRRAQMLQGMAIDGRLVRKVQITVTLRFSQLAPGTKQYHQPGVFLHYFDGIRKRIGAVGLGPLRGSSPKWRTYRGVYVVPATAREGVLQLGLNGGTGTIEVDDVRVAATR
jgi:protein-L-isoaspartate(D-aspartate) O-methyltransferase